MFEDKIADLEYQLSALESDRDLRLELQQMAEESKREVENAEADTRRFMQESEHDADVETGCLLFMLPFGCLGELGAAGGWALLIVVCLAIAYPLPALVVALCPLAIWIIYKVAQGFSAKAEESQQSRDLERRREQRRAGYKREIDEIDAEIASLKDQLTLARKEARASEERFYESLPKAFTDDRSEYIVIGPDYRRANAVDRYFQSNCQRLVQDTFGSECAYCGDGFAQLTFDHFWLPKHNGGNFAMRRKTADGMSHVLNCVPLCQSCNSSKKNSSAIDFFGPDKHAYLLQQSM